MNDTLWSAKPTSNERVMRPAQTARTTKQSIKSVLLFAVTTIGILAGATNANAQLPVMDGQLSNSDPTFNRPQGFPQGGTCALSASILAAHYTTHTFTLTAPDNVSISASPDDGAFLSPAGDTYLVLYGAGGFNPAAPCANAIAANDDAVSVQSRITTVTPLAAGTYTVVLTTFTDIPSTPFPWNYKLAFARLGALATTSPGFERPENFLQGGACSLRGGGAAYKYQTHSFRLSAPTRVMASTVIGDGGAIAPAIDTFMVLYGPGGFDPANPCANAIVTGDDVSSSSSQPRIRTRGTLPAGNYTIVMTPYSSNVPVAADPAINYRLVIEPYLGSSDLNGDGKSDLMFHNSTTGEIVGWLMNSATVTEGKLLLGNGPWTVTHNLGGSSGFYNDDVLLKNNADGTVVLWSMNGLAITAGSTLLPAGSGWSVSHVGDFNGDGRDDILLRHADGRIVLWIMGSFDVASGTNLLPAGTGYSAVHVADFNGDGKADILLRNTNDGTVVLWTMNGSTVAAGATILNANSGYTPTHTGDFNGDGKADILWRNNSNGSIVAWLMNGSTVTTGTALLGAGNWYVNQVNDFNGDGKSDILLRNADGTVVSWLMNGTSVTSGATLFGPTTAWAPVKTGDYNRDGKADIIMRNNNGTLVMWLMNGGTITSGYTILGPGFWEVVP
jgi:FG-GAP-like repeat